MNIAPISRFVLACAFLLFASSALAICAGQAVIDVFPNDDPNVPAYTYTINLEWTYAHNAHHWVIPIDLPDGNCSCADLMSAIVIPDPVGHSTGLPEGCDLTYSGRLSCDGDPDSDLEGLLLILTPDYTEGCELDSSGNGSFIFYSDMAPADIVWEYPNWYPFFTVTTSGSRCSIPLSGVFPALSCDPVSSESTSWSALKSMYRQDR